MKNPRTGFADASSDSDPGSDAEGPAKKLSRYDLDSDRRPIGDDILAQAQQDRVREEIRNSQPYRYGVISGLIDDDLLRQAREEIMSHIHFTEKETDIYKVLQTGDLANVSRLESDERKLLGGLAKVREALYSPEFRNYLSYVTECGPLSGSVQDLSVNLYTRGCHLLTHDDVIGTRRVSYILYLTPPDTPWKPKWGGALRLYPTVRPGTPEADFSVTIPPKWNQLAFFRVQPGHSFHDVEEVYVDKERLSISGWFHAPQAGEEGYEPVTTEEEEAEETATLAQLSGSAFAGDYLPQPSFDYYSDEDIMDGVEGLDELSDGGFDSAMSSGSGSSKQSKASAGTNGSHDDGNSSNGSSNGSTSKHSSSGRSKEDLLKERDRQAAGRATLVAGDLPRTGNAIVHPVTARMKDALSGMLDEGDVRYLSQYLNPEVLERLSGFRQTFGEESMVQIDGFLNDRFYKALMEAIEIDDLAKLPKTERELPSPWKLAKPPHLRRYMYLNDTAAGVEVTTVSTAAHVPLTSLREFMKSPPFARFLAAVSYLRPTARYAEARRFRPGLDYTLATSSPYESNVLEAVLSVTPSRWTETVGGYDLIMMNEEEGAADPAVYRSSASDDNAVIFTAFPAPNQFTLILRDPGLLRFIKYVSRNAAGSRWDVTATYMTEEDETTEESGDSHSPPSENLRSSSD